MRTSRWTVALRSGRSRTRAVTEGANNAHRAALHNATFAVAAVLHHASQRCCLPSLNRGKIGTAGRSAKLNLNHGVLPFLPRYLKSEIARNLPLPLPEKALAFAVRAATPGSVRWKTVPEWRTVLERAGFKLQNSIKRPDRLGAGCSRCGSSTKQIFETS